MKTGLLILVLVSLTYATPRAVSHEDIRDAILSLIHMFRDNGDKLERHELRERHLGEQLKKSLNGLDKRHRSSDNNLEAIMNTIKMLDDRLRNVETMMLQRDEKEHIHQQKTKESIDTMQASLHTWMKTVEEMIRSSIGEHSPTPPQPPPSAAASAEKLDMLEARLNSQINHLASTIEQLQDQMLKKDTEALKVMSTNLENMMANTERLLNRYETEPVGIVHSPATQDWHTLLISALEVHHKMLQDIKELSEDATKKLASLPSYDDLQQGINSTQEMLQEVKFELAGGSDKGNARLAESLAEAKSTIERTQEEILKGINDAGVIAEGLYSDITRSYEAVLKEVRRSSEVESVLFQTADNVMDTKRRIEYGVHQILLEVGDLVKLQAKELNATVNKRFDALSATIVDNQTGALSNLTSKIETEISQVWRQIGIMYQQLTASAGALDRLQQQTEMYVNGSLKTMDSMGGKVGQITSLMSEMDNNLNYLLGRLSLVTQEFNSIKSDLGTALDNIRHAFISVQEKVKEFAETGIIPIPEGQIQNEEEENQVSIITGDPR